MIERIEMSNVGRWAISALLVVSLGAIVVWNLPDSAIRRDMVPVVRPYLNATGLSQNWSMFAPDPARQTFELLANIHYADGSRDSWRPAAGDPVIGHYRGYRWRKWAGYVRLNNYRWMWAPTASWIEREFDHGGRQPVRIELVRRWRDLEAPQSNKADGDWRESVFYTLQVARGRGT